MTPDDQQRHALTVSVIAVEYMSNRTISAKTYLAIPPEDVAAILELLKVVDMAIANMFVGVSRTERIADLYPDEPDRNRAVELYEDRHDDGTWLNNRDKCETVVANAVTWLGMDATGIDPAMFADPVCRAAIEHAGDFTSMVTGGVDVYELIDTWTPPWPTPPLKAAHVALERLEVAHRADVHRRRLVNELSTLGAAW